MFTRPACLMSWVSLLAMAALPPLGADDGALDPSFGGDGIVSTGVGTDGRVARAAAVFPDGSMLAAGSAGESTALTDFYVVRYRIDGTIDSDWGDLGRQRIPIDPDMQNEDNVEAIVLDETGAATLLGTTRLTSLTSLPALVRLTPAGALDPTFGSGGIVVADDFPWPGEPWTGAAAPHLGSFLFAGVCSQCGPGASGGYFLHRRLASGAADAGFGTGGWALVPSEFPGYVGFSVYLWAVAATPDGRVVIVSTVSTGATTELQVARLLYPAGTLDPTFGGGDGFETIVLPDLTWRPSALAIDPDDGSMVIGLRSGTENWAVVSGSIARFTADGTFDEWFGFPDLVFDEGSSVDDLVIASDGKIVAVGGIDGPGAQAGGFFFARLRPNGQLDVSFDGNGVKRVEIDVVPNGMDRALGLALNGGRPVAVGFNRTLSAELGYGFALVRLQNALIFTDGFERASTAAW